MNTRRLAIGIVMVGLWGCVMPAKQPPKVVTPDFTFNPPSTASTKANMTIAVIKPSTSGTMFGDVLIQYGPDMARVRADARAMLDASKKDMESILVAKGFNTSGPFDAIDDMTYSEKEHASLLFVPEFEASMDFVSAQVGSSGFSTVSEQATVVVSGKVVLAMKEPMTGQKVLMRRLDLDPFSAPYVATAKKAGAKSGDELIDALLGGARPKGNTQLEASVLALNHFYQNAMTKIWDRLDPREILQLKTEAEKLKKLKRF